MLLNCSILLMSIVTIDCILGLRTVPHFYAHIRNFQQIKCRLQFSSIFVNLFDGSKCAISALLSSGTNSMEFQKDEKTICELPCKKKHNTHAQRDRDCGREEGPAKTNWMQRAIGLKLLFCFLIVFHWMLTTGVTFVACLGAQHAKKEKRNVSKRRRRQRKSMCVLFSHHLNTFSMGTKAKKKLCIYQLYQPIKSMYITSFACL